MVALTELYTKIYGNERLMSYRSSAEQPTCDLEQERGPRLGPKLSPVAIEPGQIKAFSNIVYFQTIVHELTPSPRLQRPSPIMSFHHA